MGYLADFVHRHGMKLGIYTCIGTETCRRNRPGRSYPCFHSCYGYMISTMICLLDVV